MGGTATAMLDNASGGLLSNGVAGALPATAVWGSTTNPTKVAIRADA